MSLEEFVNKYYLHDSSIEKVEYISEAKQVMITVNFCNWLQSWYIESEPENIYLLLKFKDVSYFHCESDKGQSVFGNFIDAVKFESDGTLIFQQIDDDNFEYYETIVKATNVEVIELESCDL